MNKYETNDLQNPKYLFYGSHKILEVVEKRQIHDSNNNQDNKDFAVFLTSSFVIATAYAFKEKIKELSDGLNWHFEIGYDANNDKVYVKMNNVNINDDIEGYIYVFPFDEKYEHQKNSIQYKCHEKIKPIDIVKVKFSEYKQYYIINSDIKQNNIE